ncbi:MAG: poly-gamma-glutamate system protein [Gemmatimonadales bacterium]|nr:poly-gamma-glutamate system protein [Gemmatimonadales bacterium]NIN13200.1 poly-gamma-glutamate system protein [Gemmatimonadales bacterium]NIN51478.1 poly-gamma-glutamate system protein [Gemmatimonadales bacterium]NIP08942.1 poly-gamma-glutamate system protein [Gemmatimonadales bacterium]NIR03730.1 poly-gamma-glutamate system protein [Gemmatimonadales bacterium]
MKPVLVVDRTLQRRIVAAGVVSLVAWPLLQTVSPRRSIPWSEEMREAAQRMHQAITTVAAFCETEGIRIDESLDPNHTGLIGPEYTPLFTTLGRLEGKRTTTNPDMAGLMVHMLRRAGVSAGDTIAVGASASFPGLMIATLSAAEVMGVHPVTILSLGASSYGATRPELNLLHIHELLLNEGVLSTAPAAVSLGGEGDVGADFDPAFREDLLQQIRVKQVPLVHDPDLRENVARRMAIYLGGAEGRRVVAFVNIGGSDANLGSSPLVLNLEPGLNTDLALPPPGERGALFAMAARGIPVIHLLHIRGLASRYGLPWDPVPLAQPGTARLRDDAAPHTGRFWLITAVYFSSLGLIAVVGRRRREVRAIAH